MIGLAVAEELQRQGFGVYGETIWWNTSPVLNTGSVVDLEGMWVNTTAVASSIQGPTYTDEVTISTRYTDPLRQGVMLMYLTDFINRQLIKYCELDLTIGIECSFPILNVGACTNGTLQAVDSEGRYVKQTSFELTYQYPHALPELP